MSGDGAATVVSVRLFVGAESMYDLTVDVVHAYYVAVGATPVLVHNVNCPAFVGRFLALMRSVGDIKTTGHLVIDGESVFKASKGVDDTTAAIDAYLRQSPEIKDPPPGFPYDTAWHADTKIAWYMRNNGIKDADMVINNPKGPCSGPASCRVAIRAILPKGDVVRIWYPGATEPVTIVGVAPRP